MDVSPRKRTKIYTLHQHIKKSQREIAKAIGISQATVHRLIKNARFENTLRSKMENKCRRKKKTMPRTDAYLLRVSKLNPRKIIFQLQQNWLLLEYQLTPQLCAGGF